MPAVEVALGTKTPYPPFVLSRPFSLAEDRLTLHTEKVSYVRKIFARTVCGLPAYMLKITGDRKRGIVPLRDRKCVIITTRARPGDTTGSYAVEGFLEFILCIIPRYDTWN